MKRFVLTVALVLSSFFVFSQFNKEALLNKNGEIYFKFEINDSKDVSWLTQMVSIDNVKGNTVYAYANDKEFNQFEATGIPYVLLPHPNEGFNPVMKDYDELKGTDAWDAYPTYTAYVAMMYAFETNYPNLCKIYDIGTTVNGRQLLVAKISDNVAVDEAEPEFFYTSSMHGDELTGYVLMLRLIDSLLTTYGTSPRITNLVNNIEIFINPLANPDGTYKTGNNSVSGAVRYNANNVDLNRNFPDIITGQYANTQPETYAFMAFAESRSFVSSCNIHGGAEVCNYPWDRKFAYAADDNWWQYVCHEYADTAQTYSPSSYMSGFTDGITNGAAWYVIDGGRQDYMNFFHQCREFTLEISNTKLPAASSLPAYWGYNRRSFINYMEQCTFGIRGMITDANTGQPVEAEVYVLNHEIAGDSSWVYASPTGNYHRLLNAGTYNVRFSAPCYETQIFNNVSVVNKVATNLNVQLVPQSNAVDFTASATSIAVGGSVSFTDQSCGNPTSWLWVITGPGSPVYIGGTTNSSQNPIVQFNTAGSYTVSLTATGAGGSFTQTKTNYITVSSCTYCTTTYSNISDDWISNVTFNTINNNSGSTTYSNFTGISTTVNPGSSYTLSVNVTVNGAWVQHAIVWIDWNKNCTFGDAGETYDLGQTPGSSGTFTLSTTVTVPAGASYGSTRLRASERYNQNPGPCDVTTYGEAEDYTVIVVNPVLIPVANFIADELFPVVGQTVSFTDLSTNTPTSWSWAFVPNTVTFIGGTTTSSQHPQVQFNEAENYSVELIAENSAGNDIEIKTNYIQVQSLDFYVNLNVMLEGAFNGSGMSTNLIELPDFPLSQPYSVSPWNYPGAEYVETIPYDIVDWILIELRDATSAATATASSRIARQAGFLLSDGSIVGLNGTGNLHFSNLTIQHSLFVVIWHRNHLPVLSANPLVKSGEVYVYDFTTSASQAFGTDAQKLLATGIYGIIGGDANTDGIVNDLDKTVEWQSDAGSSGYLSTDVNLDGQANNLDKNEVWLPNWGKGAQVP
jgi:PKD repeat protein